jgi:glycosyltransferase involved in cell wall biosynthesis
MKESQKRLAVFLPGLLGGGAERTMLSLAKGLAERGHPVDLVLAQAEGPYLAEVPESVQLVELNTRHLSAGRTFASLPALVRYLRHQQPEALLSALRRANVTAVWARYLAGVPGRVVISEQNTWSPRIQQSTSWYSRMILRLSKRFYPWADAIVAVSEGTADDLAQVLGIPRERIEVIHNPGVRPELRRKAEAPLDHPWFQPGQPPVLLAVGRLTVQKDFPTLIRAFAQVRTTRPVRLLVLGEGQERSGLEALVTELDLKEDVSLPGFVENPYAYMARASVFVLSSRWEGLPTVLMEALCCGAPLVATDCPSGPREILRDGQYGQLVPVGDTTALAQAIEVALADNRPSPPPESWRPFELETVVNQYSNLLLGG